MRRTARWLLLGLVALTIAACRSATTVLVVRHAEKAVVAASDRDPPLSVEGAERAAALATVAADAGVSAIYVTQFRRTQETGRPSAEALGLTPSVFAVGSDASQQARAVVADILAHHSGGAVLVVGHSNTVPLVIEALGGAKPVIAETEFHRLFEVTRHADGRCEVVERRYGR